MWICPAVTLAFSLKVSLMSLAFKSAVAAVLLFSIECSVATTLAASATYFSNKALESAGVHDSAILIADALLTKANTAIESDFIFL